MPKHPSLIERLIEVTGLDWLVMLVGKPAFSDAPVPFPTDMAEITSKFAGLTEDNKIDDAVNYCAQQLAREEGRCDKIESKASALINFTSIAAAFITAFAGLALDRAKIDSLLTLILTVVLFLSIVFALIWTIYLARKTLIVSDYSFAYPSARDVFDLSTHSLQSVKRERAASLFYSYGHNMRLVKRKATFLAGAQLWFRNSIFLLLVLAVLLAGHALLRPPAQTSASTSPSPQITASPTVTVPSPTPTLVPSPILTIGPTP